MKGRAKQRKMTARFRANGFVLFGRALRSMGRAVSAAFAPIRHLAAGLCRALGIQPRRDQYALTTGPDGGDR